MGDFKKLSPQANPNLWQKISSLAIDDMNINKFQQLQVEFINITTQTNVSENLDEASEKQLVQWLITLFNELFQQQDVILIHARDVGKDEPEYLPAIKQGKIQEPAKICFAHGYFASALHEISHWTIAGKQRRKLQDFGYWYAPDGRSEQQQQQFEQVEIKPQAIECLLTLACGRPFQVSQDNLFADFDTSNSTFKQDVYQLAEHFLHHPNQLPNDAQTLLVVLSRLCAKIKH